MKRIRLSTLMLLVVIAALSIAVVVQQRRAARLEAELRDQVRAKEATMNYYLLHVAKLKERLAYSAQRSGSQGLADGATGKKVGNRDGQ